LKARVLAPWVFKANLMPLILRILKFGFLRVATLERFSEVLLEQFFSPQNAINVFKREVLVKKSVVIFFLE
jgi:hypothetical protein